MKNSKPFVHLHLHTSNSLLDGAAKINDVIETALNNNMPAVAITDHGVMYGIIDFYKAAKDKGVKPIIGCETYITMGSRHDRGGTNKSPVHHLVLLATNEKGYQNLSRLVSMAHLEGFYYKPRIDFEILSKYHGGLIGLSSCLKGEIASNLMENRLDDAATSAGRYQDIFGKGNFYLEIQDHNLPEQAPVNRNMKIVSAKTGIPMVATNDVHYIKKEHASAHEVLLCLQTQTVMSDPKRMRYRTNEFYMKTRSEMDAVFSEFEGAVDRSLEIAEKCLFELPPLMLHFPLYKVSGKTQKEYLIEIAYEGMKKRYGIENPSKPKNEEEKKVITRLHDEMHIIEKAGYINYFLVVWDFVKFAHSSGIPVGPGRGSGGGSIVAYCLGITAIDPLRYDLIFERFLNLERISPPDFDIDFCQDRRGEVIEYVKGKYGRENVAQIITFQTLGPKTAIRDIGRVLEIPLPYCDKLAKMVPETPDMTLKKALETSPDFKKAYESEEDCKRILKHAFVLEDLSRNPGTHAAGVVIGDKPLIEILPLARDKNGEVITQFTMKPLEKIGFLKMDFLGLKTLTVINEAVNLIKKNHNIDIDIERIPIDDKATYELLNKGNTIGVFQLESPGMRENIKRVKVETIDHLNAMIALYRPGPMQYIEEFANRKHGKSKIDYPHKLLEPVLKETFGFMIYQEQVLKAANVLAGFSLGDGDILRRAMGKKEKEEMAKQRSKFIDGCLKKNHIQKDKASEIFDAIEKFAGYGFNKSHSAGYAIISYQTAYLKANYPAEFMAALISSEMGNPDKLPVFIEESQQMNLEILPPDVNQSYVRFHPYGKTILYGFAGIKNVGVGAAEAIIAEREKNGPYKNLVDFCLRLLGSQAINKRVLESLVKCGAFDSFGMHRARLFGGIDIALTRVSARLKDQKSGQRNMFDMLGGDQLESLKDDFKEAAEWNEGELLGYEHELLGMYLSGHPLTQYAYILKNYQISDTDIASLPEKTPVRIGGMISSISKRFTKEKNKPFAFIGLENMHGAIEVNVWSEAYERYGMHLTERTAVLVCGEIVEKEGIKKINAREIYPLADAPRHFATRVSIHVESTIEDGVLNSLKEIIKLYPGTVPLNICVLFPGREKVFIHGNASYSVFPDAKFIHAVEELLGEESVFVSISQTAYKSPPQQRSFSKNDSFKN